MIQMLQRALDPCVPPAGVSFRHLDNQLTDLPHHTGTADTLPSIRPVGSDEFAVPRQDRIGRYNGSDLAQHFSAQRLPFGRQSTALVICETNAFPVRLDLLLQDAVLFDEVDDNGGLLATDPAGERRQEELQMDSFNYAASVSDVGQEVALKCDRVSGHYDLLWQFLRDYQEVVS